MPYHIYILECVDKTIYIGWTNDIKKRVRAHNVLKSGARYTRTRRPVTLKYSETFKTKTEALRRERQLKKLTRAEKLSLIP